MTNSCPQPHFKGKTFRCPHCNAHTQMLWVRLIPKGEAPSFAGYKENNFHEAACIGCGRSSLWRETDPPLISALRGSNNGEMIFPTTKTSPPHSIDLPEPCIKDYEEARSIAQASPRGAAALLRLCIQKLCKELGKSGKNINQDIAALVKDGLSVQVQQALDVVRVIGNEAVHPGVMTEEEHEAQVYSLFNLVNIIVEQMISQPKELNALFENLPVSARQAIAKRDASK